MKIKKVCIVTPDIIGPIKNGGIGTHCYYLANYYASFKDIDVTILFTSPFDVDTESHWRNYYSQRDIDFRHVLEPPVEEITNFGAMWATRRSRYISDFLSNYKFDVIHFQDFQGNGFIPIREKKMGLNYQDTLMTVTMHSPAQWIREGMNKAVELPFINLKLEYIEKYSCENADLLLAPSKHMFDWALANGWKLAENRQVIPCLYKDDAKVSLGAGDIDGSHLIFFGRLETRKGLAVFCEAVNKLTKSDPDHGIRHISFLGKHGQVGVEDSTTYLDRFRAGHSGIKCDIISDFDSFKAIKYIKSSRGIVVIPSLLDNFPYTVTEALNEGLPFLASSIGGIPEMVSPDVLFDPKPDSLAAIMANRQKVVIKARKLFSNAESQKKWLTLVEENERFLPPPEAVAENDPKPTVSICIPYYNYGKYLPSLCQALTKTKYENIEVVVVNDGSTDPASRKVFDKEKEKYESRGWLFLSKENEGIGATRNYAARYAKGEYLIFVDADNIPYPNMVADFVQGMQRSGCDCLTCHFTSFSRVEVPAARQIPSYCYTPIGPCLDLGWAENVFGDANFIIKKDVFEKLDGFGIDRDSSWEDWEFLAKLSLSGYQMDVLPRPLVWYRHSEESFSRVTNYYKNYKRATQPYYDLGYVQKSLLLDVALPLFFFHNQPRVDSQQNPGEEGAPPQELPTRYKMADRLYNLVSRYPYIKRWIVRAYNYAASNNSLKRWVQKW